MNEVKFKTRVHRFTFDRMKLAHFQLLTSHIMKDLYAIDEKLSGSTDYIRLKKKFEQFSEVCDRNPALFQTQFLRENVDQLRRAMMLLGMLVKSYANHSNGTKKANAKKLWYIIKPSLKPHPSSMGIVKVLTMGGKIAEDLQTPAAMPLVEALELTTFVHEIDTLSHAGDTLYSERGNEMEHRLQLGSATKRRPALTDALKRVLYSLLQALHSMAPNAADRAELDEVILHINGLLDSFKIYAKGGHGGGGGEGGEAPQPGFHADGEEA
jgi:hypothetical protein